MELKLEAGEFSKDELPKIMDFISTQQAVGTSIKDGNIVFDEYVGELSQAEIFKMGMEYGEEKEKSLWTKPESFWIAKSFGDVLKQAIDNYMSRSDILVDTIAVEESENNPNLVKVIVHPTQVVHLFSIASEFGKLTKDLSKV